MHCGKMIEEVKESADGSATGSLASFMTEKTEERVSRFERKRTNNDPASADRPTRPRADGHGQGKGQNLKTKNSNALKVTLMGKGRPRTSQKAPIIVVKDEIVDFETDFMLQSMDTLADVS